MIKQPLKENNNKKNKLISMSFFVILLFKAQSNNYVTLKN